MFIIIPWCHTLTIVWLVQLTGIQGYLVYPQEGTRSLPNACGPILITPSQPIGNIDPLHLAQILGGLSQCARSIL